MTRQLIINADDCNLTAGVTRGILLAHDRGVVTSTTVLMNLPLSEETVKEIKKRRTLGLGIHLNVTLGMPLSSPSKVHSLVKPDGFFRRPADYEKKRPSIQDLIREYAAQIRLFEKRFGRMPDHIDTHHHLHDRSGFFEAYASVARKWKVPVRRCQFFQKLGERETTSLKTTDYLFGNLEAKFCWTPEPFWGVVENLPEGTNEIACHPGFCDTSLRKISSLTDAREKELNLFSDGKLRKRIANLGVELTHFNRI